MISLLAAPASVSAGSSVILTATASDNVGVSSVKFYRDDTLLATDTSAPYEYTQVTTAADVGTLGFKAVASDAAGNTASAAASVTVTTPRPPVSPDIDLNISAITISGNLPITAAVSSQIGIAKVEFLLDGKSVATDVTAPYQVVLPGLTSLQNGLHTLVVKATDQNGQVSEDSQTFLIAIDDNEPNNSVLAAKTIKIGDILNGTIAGQAQDVDYFRFNAVKGDQLKLGVMGKSLTASTLDPYITLYSPDGQTMLERSDDGGPGEDAEILFNVPAAGSYVIAVTSFDIHDDPDANDNLPTNFYQLALTRR
ncbi:Ig-like domain-containing protein [Deinococcus alpinitundrae]|uniref:Ig-like domain-containing protein n=1 Tax=Deinococcus alpinitundrae TaxID=468913 RepID=UPI001ED92131|nr:Ig-like domain-containing protein [Deinococcus alpinitundrae]